MVMSMAVVNWLTCLEIPKSIYVLSIMKVKASMQLYQKEPIRLPLAVMSMAVVKVMMPRSSVRKPWWELKIMEQMMMRVIR